MKFFAAILSVISLAFFLPWAISVSDAQEKSSPAADEKRNTVNMDEIFRAEGKNNDIEYRINGGLQKKGVSEGVDFPNETIVVEYELKNTGAKSYVVYDRGHSNESGGFVYVEPAAGGAVELSLKAFSEPAGKNCPARFVAVVPRGSLLKSGETVKEKAYVELPLKAKTPFDDYCEPPAQIAPNASRIKFCIGFQAVEDEKTKIAENGQISPLPDLKNQQLICTEIGEIK